MSLSECMHVDNKQIAIYVIATGKKSSTTKGGGLPVSLVSVRGPLVSHKLYRFTLPLGFCNIVDNKQTSWLLE